MSDWATGLIRHWATKLLRQVPDSDEITDAAALRLIRDLSLDRLQYIAARAVAEEARHRRREVNRRIEERAQRRALGLAPNAQLPGPPRVPEYSGVDRPKSNQHQSWAYNEDGRRACRFCGCNQCMDALAEYDAIHERQQARLFADLSRITTQYRDELRMEWEQELLDSSFALPDGTLVRWADATVGQHQERHRMLMLNAAANLKAAARHEAAIEAIQQAHAVNLGEVVRETAA